jgi:hypothetical protein
MSLSIPLIDESNSDSDSSNPLPPLPPVPPLSSTMAPSEEGKALFSMSITCGNSFRHFAEFARRISKEMPIVVTNVGLSIVMCSNSRQLVLHAAIRKEDLIEFYIDQTVSNSGSFEGINWSHSLNVDTNELVTAMRTVSKREPVRIRQLVINGPLIVETPSGALTHVKTYNFSAPLFDISETERRASCDPAVTIALSRFSAELTALSKSRLGRVKLGLREHSLSISGSSQTNVSKRTVVISSTLLAPPTLHPPPFLSTINLQPNTFAALGKIGCINVEGVARFYNSPNTPKMIRIEIPMGCIGTVRIYLVDISNSSASESAPS